MKNKWQFLAFLLLIVGCSSTPSNKASYYLLNHVTTDLNSPNNHKTKTISFNKIILPDYLLQPKLVMKVTENQLHYSRFHLWAENLPDSMTKILINHLNTAKTQYHFVKQTLTAKPEKMLNLQIDHFYPTQQSEVILSGKYWFTTEKNQNTSQTTHFHFSQKLLSDGYPHAVSQMQNLLAQLSQQLNQQLN